jgi:hypothetical protein
MICCSHIIPLPRRAAVARAYFADTACKADFDRRPAASWGNFSPKSWAGVSCTEHTHTDSASNFAPCRGRQGPSPFISPCPASAVADAFLSMLCSILRRLLKFRAIGSRGRRIFPMRCKLFALTRFDGRMRRDGCPNGLHRAFAELDPAEAAKLRHNERPSHQPLCSMPWHTRCICFSG